tara:strand:- start:26 stop:394 length:369 start_codon:yes stop_codon:yes gene_type:complete
LTQQNNYAIISHINRKENMKQATYIKDIEYNGKKIKLPFKILSITTRDETVEVQASNRFTQESIGLPSFARAVYEHILHAEWKATMEDKELGTGGSKIWDEVRAGLNWFRKYFAKQYMVLLD